MHTPPIQPARTADPPSAGRLYWADLLRISAMLAVMVQHLTFNTFWRTWPVDSFHWQTLNFYGAMTKWCVPVFVMISGMLFLDPRREMSGKKLFSRHLLRLAAAFLFWSALYVLYTNRAYLGQLTPARLTAMLKQLLTGHYHMWFVFLIAGLYLLVPLLRPMVQAFTRRQLEYFLLLWLAFSSLLPALRLIPGLSILGVWEDKIDMGLVVGFVGYFVLGYYLTAYPLGRRGKRALYLLGITGGFLGTLALSIGLSLHNGAVDESFYKNLSPNILLMSVAVFVFFQQEVSRLRLPARWKKGIATLSGCCFGAFLSHDFFISFSHLLGFTTDTIHPVFSVWVMLLFVAAGSFLLTWILRKIPFFRTYLS